ncbi:MAG: peptide chain release factor-like protein [Myxococcota bacterium]
MNISRSPSRVPSQVLRIGSGRGPREARHFVGMLANALPVHLSTAGVVVHEVVRHGDHQAPGRVALRVDGSAHEQVSGLLGTHLLLADLRGRRSRRRWFALVELDEVAPTSTIALPRHELDIRFVRSGGPGGQNVNKRSTAVRIVHHPTGLSTRCDEHRSQARNRADALAALTRMVARHRVEERWARCKVKGWQERRGITAHCPVMCWRLHPTEQDTIVPVADR